MIRLIDICPLASPTNYKVHFSRWNGAHEPLDVWVNDPEEFVGWQTYRPKRDEFNRPRIFSLVRFYHEPDMWLFTGIFDVEERFADRYVVSLSSEMKAHIGRLKIAYGYRDRSPRLKLENHLSDFEVSEILREPYQGRAFPGFDNIDLSFSELEALVKNARPDWVAALSSVKGVYLISDTTTGKRYVGSAYGDQGIWSRWSSYAASGHGGNAELKRLSDTGAEYCRTAFRFSLLEYRPSATPDQTIIDREGFWKRILLTRGELGLNRN